jgi:hypothetical protein
VVGNRYAALVKGSSAVFPRGFLWLIPVWYAAIVLVVKFKVKPASWFTWYAPYALGITVLATLTLMMVLSTMRNNAFMADDSGILLGLRAGARRRLGRRRRQNVHLRWAQIQQLKIAGRPYGARIDIVLHPGAVSERHHLLWQAVATLATLVMPLSYLFRSPGVLRPRSYNPPRYRIQLWDVRAEDLRQGLAAVTPADVPILVRRSWRARALGALRRNRLATAA